MSFAPLHRRWWSEWLVLWWNVGIAYTDDECERLEALRLHDEGNQP